MFELWICFWGGGDATIFANIFPFTLFNTKITMNHFTLDREKAKKEAE